MKQQETRLDQQHDVSRVQTVRHLQVHVVFSRLRVVVDEPETHDRSSIITEHKF